jgi:hypothetical protein
MKMVDHARLVQALQDTSILVACKIDPEKHSVAAQRLQYSIAVLLGELKKDWRDVIPQNAAEPSVGIPD